MAIWIIHNTKTLHYDIIEVSEGIDVNKISKPKECHICHYWCFLNKIFKFQPNVCYRCYDLLMSTNLSDIAILNITSLDYCCISKNETIDVMQNDHLTEKGGTFSNIKINNHIYKWVKKF